MYNNTCLASFANTITMRTSIGELTQEQQKSLTQLRLRIEVFNRTVPELRISLPSHCWSYAAYLPLELNICAEYFFQAERIRFDEDAGSRVAELLTSFSDKHPLEWRVCGWKNDFIAQLMLGELGGSVPEQNKEIAECWLKAYWTRDEQKRRELEVYLSPSRMAASAAVLELEMLELKDDLPHLSYSAGYKAHALFVDWLNTIWLDSAQRKKGKALVDHLVQQFRKKRQHLRLTDDDLAEMCDAYRTIESRYSPREVPPSQVVLTVVAKRHKVSARLVSKVRAEQNARRKAGS
jgi:hypothetical protein